MSFEQAQNFQRTYDKLSKGLKIMSSNVKKLKTVNSEAIKNLLDKELLSVTSKMTELGEAIITSINQMNDFNQDSINKMREEISKKIVAANTDNKSKLEDLSKSIQVMVSSDKDQSGGTKEIQMQKLILQLDKLAQSIESNINKTNNDRRNQKGGLDDVYYKKKYIKYKSKYMKLKNNN